MLLCYSGKSRPSAQAIADEDDSIELVRSSRGDINWGRARANTSLNPDISNATNKRVMRSLFKAHDVPMPYLFTNNEDMGSGPLVGRPDYHTKGRGFWKCNNFQDVQRAIRGTRRKKAATHFMEFVESEREYRVHIFKGKSIRISQKSFCDCGEPRCKDYTTAKPDRRVRPVREAAKKAVEALGLDFGAVDILAAGENNEQVWVLEVNAAPGLGGTMPALYASVFKQYMDGEWDG